MRKVLALNGLAKKRGQSLAHVAVAWVLRNATVTSAVVGASRVAHIDDAVAALANRRFADEELAAIEAILAG